MDSISGDKRRGYSICRHHMSDRTCAACGRIFACPYRLSRHHSGKSDCTARKSPQYKCLCGKMYVDVSSLYRHRKGCDKFFESRAAGSEKKVSAAREGTKTEKSGSAPVTVVQNIQNIQHIQVNALGHHQQVSVSPIGQIGGPAAATGPNSSVHSTGSGPDATRFPGWPAKWPAPQVVPATFKPLGFEISQPALEAAVGSLLEDEKALCSRGDTLGVSRLLVEILKRVHSDPRERNVYLNPARADQALVFVPSSWSAQPLEEAAQTMFARIRVLLEGAPRESEKGVKSAVAGARKGCKENLPQLAKASRGQLTAHLENVRRATTSGEDWLGTGGEPSDQPAFIGKEFAGHLDPPMLIPALEQASGVGLRPGEEVDKAARAIAECSRYILHNRPINLTVLPIGEGRVYAHEREAGWAVWASDRAAAALLRRSAAEIDSQLHDAPESPLVALRPWLRERLEEVLSSPQGRATGEWVVRQYTAAAARYYSSLPRVQDPHDRKEAARRIVLGEPLYAYEVAGPAAGPAGALADSSAVARRETPDTQLTEADLTELLGLTWG